MATTSLCFFPSQDVLNEKPRRFRVQVTCVDGANQGISHSTYAKALEHAICANSNGHDCFIHLD
jgi:hypothetical protein